MAEPDYLICLECDSPVYGFEWVNGRVIEVTCPVCGNEDLSAFATEDEIDEFDRDEHGDEGE